MLNTADFIERWTPTSNNRKQWETSSCWSDIFVAIIRNESRCRYNAVGAYVVIVPLPYCIVNVLNMYTNRQTSITRRIKYKRLNISCFVLQLPLPNPLKLGIKPIKKCCWSSADRRCYNCIWVINQFIASMVRPILDVWLYKLPFHIFLGSSKEQVAESPPWEQRWYA